MVQLITNAPRFYNDISEEIRLLIGAEEIVLTDSFTDEAAMQLRIDLMDGSEGRRAVGTLFPAALHCTIPVEKPDPTDPLDAKRQDKRAVKLTAYTLFRQLSSLPTPWGSLTGIRPTKLLRELTQREGEEAAKKRFLDVFGVSREKYELAQHINEVQRPVIAAVTPRDADVYIGIPYCRSRCLYCSFGAEVPKHKGVLDEYLLPLFTDIQAGAALLREGKYRVRALYVGGGTPTVLDAEQLERLMDVIKSAYSDFDGELTVEAGRPDTITAEKLSVLRRYGTNRVSVNPQTMNDETLRVIGRFHSSEDIKKAFALVRDSGIPVVNMDLIAGLPGEGLEQFQRSLDGVTALSPENLTVHTLAIKRSSRLKAQLDAYPLPSSQTVETMIHRGAEAAEALKMRPYYLYRQKYMQGNLENVGYALNGTDCVYNIDMMEETVSIMAHGAGAMTKRVYGGGERVERLPNPKDVPSYADKLKKLQADKRTLFIDN